MNSICLVLDRLHAGFVGAYGNSWIETPEFDRLAGQSFLFDQALVDSPQLAAVYRSCWQGWHALLGPPPLERPALPALLAGQGLHTVLITDEPAVAGHPLAAQFDELVKIELRPPTAPAETIEDTHLAQCFATLLDAIQSLRPPFFLWCHLAALGATWDAPREFRQRYVEEGDPEPGSSAAVPGRMLPPNFDADELRGINQAYAGQVLLLDTCLGALLEDLDETGLATQSLLAMLSPRGFPLGEHGRIGPCDDALYGPLVHVPWMIRFPDGLGAGVRTQSLVEPADLWATLLDWHAVPGRPESPSGRSLLDTVRDERTPVHDRLYIVGQPPEQAIRTPAWYLRMAAEPALYAKPDDRWEMNNVVDRCRDVVELLQQTAQRYREALVAGRTADLAPLEDVLMRGMG